MFQSVEKEIVTIETNNNINLIISNIIQENNKNTYFDNLSQCNALTDILRANTAVVFVVSNQLYRITLSDDSDDRKNTNNTDTKTDNNNKNSSKNDNKNDDKSNCKNNSRNDTVYDNKNENKKQHENYPYSKVENIEIPNSTNDTIKDIYLDQTGCHCVITHSKGK